MIKEKNENAFNSVEGVIHDVLRSIQNLLALNELMYSFCKKTMKPE